MKGRLMIFGLLAAASALAADDVTVKLKPENGCPALGN
jgi:hypothetical protein